MSRERKISKLRDGSNVVITVEGFEPIVCNLDSLTDEIRKNLLFHGAFQKLGDSAAGLQGTEAVESIKETWQTLSEGKWTTRVPGKAKVSVQKIKDGMATLSDADKEALSELLKKCGVTVAA